MYNKMKVYFSLFMLALASSSWAQSAVATIKEKNAEVINEISKEVAQEVAKEMARDVSKENSNVNSSETTKEVVPPETVIDPRILAVKNLETLYFDLDLSLSKDLTVQEIGVSDLSSITNAVIDAWKKWAQKDLPQFKNVEDFKALNFKEAEQNPKNYVVEFKAHLKKLPRASITGRLDLEVSAQYVVVRLSDRKILSSFDFPNIQRTLETKVQKELSSKVASLVFNLLNAKTADLNQVLASQFTNDTSTMLEHKFAIRGAQSLLEINKLNTLLRNINAKPTVLCKLETQIKSFSTDNALIALESLCSELNMMEYLKSLGQLEIDNGRVFHFLPNEKSFEIFTVSPHNEKKEMPTP